MKKLALLLLAVVLLMGCSSADPLTETTYNVDGYTYYSNGEWINVNNNASEYENGGNQEIDVSGLSGLLADSQTPLAHASSHENGGSDEVSLYSLLQQSIYRVDTNGGWATTSTGAASTDQTPTRLAVLTGGTHTCSERAHTYPFGLSTTSQYINWNSEFKFFTFFSPHHSDPQYIESWLYFIQSNTLGASDLNARGIGINVKWVDASNQNRLYICSHDGTTYSETDTGQNLTKSQIYRLELIFTPATSIVAKLDGVTVATKTTNIPTGTGGDSRWGIATARSGGADTSAYDGIRIYYPMINGQY